jgi:hypothetical protein
MLWILNMVLEFIIFISAGEQKEDGWVVNGFLVFIPVI